MKDALGLPQLLRQRLKAQADLFAALTSHPTLVGAGRENALAELFRQLMPRRFEIFEGSVAILDADQRPTRSTHQLDMIVADTMDYPTLLRSGDVAVVVSQSVRAVMEVKSDLKRGVKFLSALIQISRARQLLKPTDPVFTGLFSFGAPANAETLRDWLSDVVALRELLATRRGEPHIMKIRDALLGNEDIDLEDETDLLEVLRNDNLPDVIAADHGAVARIGKRQGGSAFYTFLGGTSEMPSVMVLVDQFIEQLAAAAAAAVQDAMATVRAHFSIDANRAPDLADLELPDLATPSPMAS